MSFCPNCSHELYAGMNFCPGCGRNLADLVLDPEPVFEPEPAVEQAPPPRTAGVYQVILLSDGDCSKSEAAELLEDLLGYDRSDAKDLVKSAPVAGTPAPEKAPAVLPEVPAAEGRAVPADGKQQKTAPGLPVRGLFGNSGLFFEGLQGLIQPFAHFFLGGTHEVALGQEQSQLILVHPVDRLDHSDPHAVVDLDILTFHVSALIAHFNGISPVIINNHICAAFRAFHSVYLHPSGITTAYFLSSILAASACFVKLQKQTIWSGFFV